jgi:hypothetical protein
VPSAASVKTPSSASVWKMDVELEIGAETLDDRDAAALPMAESLASGAAASSITARSRHAVELASRLLEFRWV